MGRMTPRNLAFAATRRSSGFSLIELLCVMAIMVILYCLYFGAWTKPYQRRQQEACATNLRFSHQALRSFALDHQDRYPYVTNAATSEIPLSLLVPSATTRTEIFICPGSGHKRLPEAQPFSDRKISYAFLMGLEPSAGSDQWIMADALIDLKPKAVGDVAFAPDSDAKTGRNHRAFGGVVLFADGRAERTPSKSAFALTMPARSLPLNPRP